MTETTNQPNQDERSAAVMCADLLDFDDFYKAPPSHLGDMRGRKGIMKKTKARFEVIGYAYGTPLGAKKRGPGSKGIKHLWWVQNEKGEKFAMVATNIRRDLLV